MMKAAPLTFKKKLALEIWRKREAIIRQEHPLRQLFWECTLKCNLHCRHCGSDCRQMVEQRDMPKEDFLRVLDSVASKTDPHKVFVIVSGGEPLMRNDLEECCAAIYAKGFPWGIVTNALYLTPQRYIGLLKALDAWQCQQLPNGRQCYWYASSDSKYHFRCSNMCNPSYHLKTR